MTRRKKIPKRTQDEVLTLSGRRCCFCFGINADFRPKKGQIAHLDRDPSNNDLDNLAWLCFDHHDEYDSRTSQSKGLTIGEAKRYRDELYQTVEKSRQKVLPDCRGDTSKVYLLPRIRSGKELIDVAGGAFFYKLDNDEPKTEEEMELIRSFFNNVVDFCEDLIGAEAGAAVGTAFWFNPIIEELEQYGFRVFGRRDHQTAIVNVIRADSPTIIEGDKFVKLLSSN